mgnify:CR=1 FL=1
MVGERIRAVRRALDLTQTEFGRRIGMKQNTIALIEGGRNTSDQTLKAICREFNVSEEWLRDGRGEMFLPKTRDEELAEFFGNVQGIGPESFKRRFVAMLSRLDEEDWVLLEQMAEKLLAETKKE